MRGHGSKMARKKELAINALLTKGSLEAAAQACGLNQQTLRRWMKDPEFSIEYRAARDQVLQQSIGVLSSGSMHAAAVFLKTLNDPQASLKHKLYAARHVIEFALRGAEILRWSAALPQDEVILTQEEVINSYMKSVTAPAVNPPAADPPNPEAK